MFRYGKMQLKRNVEARSFRDLRDLVKNSERQKKKKRNSERQSKSNGKPLKCLRKAAV